MHNQKIYKRVYQALITLLFICLVYLWRYTGIHYPDKPANKVLDPCNCLEALTIVNSINTRVRTVAIMPTKDQLKRHVLERTENTCYINSWFKLPDKNGIPGDKIYYLAKIKSNTRVKEITYYKQLTRIK